MALSCIEIRLMDLCRRTCSKTRTHAEVENCTKLQYWFNSLLSLSLSTLASLSLFLIMIIWITFKFIFFLLKQTYSTNVRSLQNSEKETNNVQMQNILLEMHRIVMKKKNVKLNKAKWMIIRTGVSDFFVCFFFLYCLIITRSFSLTHCNYF